MTDAPLTKKERERRRLELVREHKARNAASIEARLRLHVGVAVDTATCLYEDAMGNLQECPALDARFVRPLGFVAFLPRDNMAVAGDEAPALLCAALGELLLAPHYVFWSHAMFDKELARALDSFLRYCTRPYDDEWRPYEAGQPRALLFERVFKVLVRASTARETRDFFMTPDVHSAWVRSGGWFALPRLLDVCVLYRGASSKLVGSVVAEAFRADNRLFTDLQKSAVLVAGALRKAFGVATTDARALRDRELYLDDALCVFHALFDVFPRAIRQVQLAHDFLALLVGECHSKWLPSLSSAFAPARRERMERLCVGLAAQLLEQCFLVRIFDSGSNKYAPAVAEETLARLEGWLSSGPDSVAFVAHLQDAHNVSGRLRKMLDTGTGLPRERVARIAQQIDAARDPVRGAVDAVTSVVPNVATAYVREALRVMDNDSARVIDALLRDDRLALPAGLDPRTGMPVAAAASAAGGGGGGAESGKGKEELDEFDCESAPLVVRSAHVGRKVMDTTEEVDHTMRVFISRYVTDAYGDEMDDSYAIHANLTVEPLAEDEEEGRTEEEEAVPEPEQAPPSGTNAAPPSTSAQGPAGRGRGRGKAQVKKKRIESNKRKDASLKKHGML